MNQVILKPGKEKALIRKHPWIFSGAIDTLVGNPENGSSVQILDSNKNSLGIGAFSPNSQIRVRIWSFENEVIDEAFFEKRISSSIQRRKILKERYEDTAWRLIHAESDHIPGLIVDQYDDVLVVQILSSGIEYHKEAIFKVLKQVTGLNKIFERSDLDIRKLEGLKKRIGVVSGDVPPELRIKEAGYDFIVDLENSQKTGFYLDQRINRRIVAGYCKNKSVLNVFAFTGGFSIYAMGEGASCVTSLDSSNLALDLAKRNQEINGFKSINHELIEDDAFLGLRKLRDQARKFDVIILDPPKFAPTTASVRRASRAYKDINLLAFKLLNPGGILATFSCSGGVGQDLFQKIVADAALDANTDAQILERLHQGPDHPVSLAYPEGAYLKGLICLKY